jgi:hypothetical protein
MPKPKLIVSRFKSVNGARLGSTILREYEVRFGSQYCAQLSLTRRYLSLKCRWNMRIC